MEDVSNSRIDIYLEAWSESLAELLSQLEATAWRTEPATDNSKEKPAVTFACRVGKALHGVQFLSIGHEDATGLLSLFLGEPAHVNGQPDATQMEALTELFRQWAGLAATRLKPTFGEVSIDLSASDVGEMAGAVSRSLCVRSDKAKVSVGMTIDAGLSSTLDRRPPVAAAKPEAAQKNLDALLREGNLDLLLDVELGVTLRFGSRRAPLREVLELSPGAVLELNREIQEPVDLILNERVIAQGDVVVIDGNYGLQITKVISPEQRLHTL